jgi:hypothetical protein
VHAGLRRCRLPCCVAMPIAAMLGAAARVVRSLLDSMQQAEGPRRRVDLLYLLDSVLQVHCMRCAAWHCSTCGMVALRG